MTSIYDVLLAEWANLHPEHPDPRFNEEEAEPLTFRWPATVKARAANGRFVKNGGK